MSNKVNPFVKSSIVYIAATVIGQGAAFLGIIIFTRIMDQSDYGRYSTYYAYVPVLTTLAGANLYYSINNAYIDYKNRIHEYRKTVLFLSGIIFGFILVAVCTLYKLLLKTNDVYILAMAILHAYSFFVVNYRLYSANMENDYKKKQWLLVLPNILQLLLGAIFIMILPRMAFNARVFGSMLGVACCAGPAYVEMMRCKGKVVVYADWKYALSISLPSIIMSLSFELMQQSDKVMISNICGLDDTAVYSVIYYMGYALIAVDQAVAPVRQLWLYKCLDKQKLKNVKTIQKWYLILAMLIVTGIFMIAPEVIRIIAPTTYWEYKYVIPFVIGACMMMLYRFYTEVILFFKRNAVLSGTVLLSALVNVGLNAFLIPKAGAIAAGYTTVIAYMLLFVLSKIIADQNIKNLYSLRFFMIFILCICVSGLFYYYSYNYFIMRLLVYGCVLIFILGYSLIRQNEWRVLLVKED